jgi:hypothetical protein
MTTISGTAHDAPAGCAHNTVRHDSAGQDAPDLLPRHRRVLVPPTHPAGLRPGNGPVRHEGSALRVLQADAAPHAPQTIAAGR